MARSRWSVLAPFAFALGTACSGEDALDTSSSGVTTAEPEIWVSTSKYRSDATPLEGRTVYGPIFVFTSPVTRVKRVDFYVDDPDRTNAPYNIEYSRPFDFASTNSDGTARLYDTRANLTHGMHTITAHVVFSNKRRRTVTASFLNDPQAPTDSADAGVIDDAAIIDDAGTIDGATPPPPPPPDSELDRACTPTVTLQLEDTDASRSRLFLDAVNDQPEAYIQGIGRHVCRILYRNASEVRVGTQLKLIIRYDPDVVAWKAGNGTSIEVMISTAHLRNVHNAGRDVEREVAGILYHEMTHMYQYDDSDGHGVSGGLIEGVADFVRIEAGYTPDGARPSGDGNWSDGYTKTAFFLVWVDERHTDFLYRLNLTMNPNDGDTWTTAAFQNLTGKSVDQLWSEYRASL